MNKEAIKGRPAKNGVRLFLAQVLRWLVEPTAGAGEKDRQKLSLLSAFLLLITINSLIGVIVTRGMDSDFWISMLFVTAISAVGYGLSRTRYYKPALIIALGVPALSVIGAVIIGTEPTNIMQSLAWLVLPFLLASIFLSRLTTLIVAIGYLVFLAVILPFTAIAPEATGEMIAFFFVVFFLVIAIAAIRKRGQSRVENELVKRVKAEEELRVNEERFRLLADNASDMIIRLQLSPTFKTDYVSPSSERITGYAPEEFYADPELVKKMVHPEDRQLFTDYADLKKSEYRPISLRLVRKDGAVIWAEQVFTPIYDKSGQPVAVHAISRDVTERTLMEQVLFESSERLKALSEESPVMICNIDLESNFQYVNKKFEEVTQYSRGEIMGKNGFKLGMFHEEVFPLLKERMKAKVNGDPPRPIEVQFIRQDGELIWISMMAEPIKDNDVPVGLQIIANDITERKRMEEEIRKSEERYRMIFESANDVIILLDNKGDIVDVNPRIGDIGGYSRGQLLGKNFRTLAKLMSKKSAAIIAKNFMFRMQGIDVPPYEVEMYRGDGKKLNVEISAVAVKDKDKVIGTLATLRDVTERRKAESALRYQRELIDQIIATTPNAVMVIDREMKVLLANTTFYKNFGLKKARVENKPIHEIIEGEELKQALSSTIKNNKKNLSFELRYQLRGVPRIFITSIVKMQNNRYLILLNDVTEEREKQERLYLTDRLASVGEMASGVAHELNNPLTSIIGLSKLLARQEVFAETKEDLESINAEAQRCAAIVKNLLAFARKHKPRREPLQVTKVVEDVLQLRAYEHRAQNITVETDLPDDLPEVLADYFQLQQVFLNIILNAETAMVDAKGKGTLRITSEETDGHIRIPFSDDGPGIAKETMGLIFNPFFTTKEVGNGTGLGLSICYGIVASHGGKIYARNNNDEGATFVVELPVAGN
jgi:two-component system NtrC family sensor kinase